MAISMNRQLSKSSEKQRGFTLIELMIVIAIIGILAAISYPSYQRYVIKSKRTDMMSEMHNIANQIESRKLAQGSYSNALKTGLEGGYPRQNPLYTVSISPDPLTAQWQIAAETIDDTQMDGDGDLSLNYQSIKCRASTCGSGDEWNK